MSYSTAHFDKDKRITTTTDNRNTGHGVSLNNCHYVISSVFIIFVAASTPYKRLSKCTIEKVAGVWSFCRNGDGKCTDFLHKILENFKLALVNLIMYWLYHKYCFVIQTALRLVLMIVVTRSQILQLNCTNYYVWVPTLHGQVLLSPFRPRLNVDVWLRIRTEWHLFSPTARVPIGIFVPFGILRL